MFPNVHQVTLAEKGLHIEALSHEKVVMVIKSNGIYFLREIKELIHDVGGESKDPKERPVVALIQSEDDPTVYWAIPVGDAEHRSVEQMERIQKFIDYPKSDVRHNYYHVGKTDKTSIFFISDVVPITPAYIDKEYLTFNSHHYVIKNKQLLMDLTDKLKRILSFEQSKIKQSGKFYFRQNIYGIYEMMLSENKLFNELHNNSIEE